MGDVVPTVTDMLTSLEDARFFHSEINAIVRGQQDTHDLRRIRRYFRGYLHCWKAVFLKSDKTWVPWIQRWQQQSLSPAEIEVCDLLRETRDFDTHEGMIEVSGEVAAGLFPIVMIIVPKPPQPRRELISTTEVGLELAAKLIRDHPTFT